MRKKFDGNKNDKIKYLQNNLIFFGTSENNLKWATTFLYMTKILSLHSQIALPHCTRSSFFHQIGNQHSSFGFGVQQLLLEVFIVSEFKKNSNDNWILYPSPPIKCQAITLALHYRYFSNLQSISNWNVGCGTLIFAGDLQVYLHGDRFVEFDLNGNAEIG